MNVVLYSQNLQESDKFYCNIHQIIYNQLLLELKREFKVLLDHVKQLKDKGTKQNIEGFFLALVAQTYENCCMLAMKKFLEIEGFKIGSMIYDGIHVRKKELGSTMPQDVISTCEDYIHMKTGFQLKIVEKSMINMVQFLESIAKTIERDVDDDAEFDPMYAVSIYNEDKPMAFVAYMN